MSKQLYAVQASRDGSVIKAIYCTPDEIIPTIESMWGVPDCECRVSDQDGEPYYIVNANGTTWILEVHPMEVFGDFSIAERFARRCEVTHKGMSEGYLIAEHMPVATEEEALKICKDAGYTSIDEAYEDDYIMHTSWEDENEWQYVEVDGKYYVIEDL